MDKNKNDVLAKVTLGIMVCILVFVALGFGYNYFIKTSTKQALPGGSEQAKANDSSASLDKENKFSDGKFIVIVDEIPPETIADETIAEKEAELLAKKVADAAQKYYDSFSSQAEMISKNGLLYDVPSGAYVTNDIMINSEVMAPEDKENKSIILFVKSSDLEEIGLDISKNLNNSLAICGIYEIKDGYVVKTSSGEGGFVSKKRLEGMLEKYSIDKGKNIRLNQNSKKHKETLQSINDFRGDNKNLDVRYLAANDKYGYGVVSPVGEPANIKAYVLENVNNKWNVVMDGIEGDYQYRASISKKIPDFNMGLLPLYNLFYHTKFVETDYTKIVDAMQKGGNISYKDKKPNFICGNGQFIYMSFDSGKKYVGMLKETGWDLAPVKDFEAAEVYIIENTEDPPLFIVKQEY